MAFQSRVTIEFCGPLLHRCIGHCAGFWSSLSSGDERLRVAAVALIRLAVTKPSFGSGVRSSNNYSDRLRLARGRRLGNALPTSGLTLVEGKNADNGLTKAVVGQISWLLTANSGGNSDPAVGKELYKTN